MSGVRRIFLMVFNQFANPTRGPVGETNSGGGYWTNLPNLANPFRSAAGACPLIS
jgi:hypothetical protein